MFLLYILAAIAGYALQSALMASYYRRMDQMSAVAYRGLSLGLTMAPVLLFVPAHSFAALAQTGHLVLLASLFAAFANWANASAFLFLSVGVAISLCMSVNVVVSSVLSFLLLGEVLSGMQIALIAALLTCVAALGLMKSHSSVNVRTGSALRGMLLCAIYGVLICAAYVYVGSASRITSPLLVGYLWESIIGVLAFIAAIIRGLCGGTGMQKVCLRDFAKIALFSSPTVVGTGCYAIATTLGPIGLIAAALSTITVASAVLANIMYGEKLSRAQWLLIALACLLIAGLKLVH